MTSAEFKELEAKRRDAAYQKLHVEEFDDLIECINRVRRVCQLNGDMDHLEPGKKGDGADCPIHNTVAYKRSPFGKVWVLSVDDQIRLERNVNRRQLRERWPNYYGLMKDGLTMWDQENKCDVQIAEIDSDRFFISFIFPDEVIGSFVGAFDDETDADLVFLNSTLAENELADVLDV